MNMNRPGRSLNGRIHPLIAIALLASGVLFAPVAHGQTTGTIYGRVADQQGAAVTDATVTVTNVEKNINRTSNTDAAGAYIFTLLPVGSYSIAVQASGFRLYRQEAVELQVQENLRADVKLEVGNVSEQVTVNAEPPQVDTASSTLGEVVDAKRIEDLPLNGRNFLQLGLLQAGVAPAVPGTTSQGGGTTNTPGGIGVNFSVNGLRVTSNNYLLDGVNNVEPFTGTATIVPSVDAIQEFRILTNMYNAEFGRGGGSIVTILTKSGSNKFHGSAYEFLRNNIFDSRNFFSPTVPALKQNQFGATFGGRIITDRTFFFASYEGFRQRHGVPSTALVPSLAERNGDFSQDAVQPINPATKQPFLNNVIPPGMISTLGREIINLYPAPNLGPNIWSGTPLLLNDRNQLDVRIDHALKPGKNTLMGRYILDQGSFIQPNGQSIINGFPFVSVPNFGTTSPNRFQNLALADTHVFSQKLLNEFRFSYQRSSITNGDPTNNASPASLGFTYPVDSPILGPPGIAVSGFSGLGYNIFNNYDTNLEEFSDNLSWNHGRHSFKFGGNITRTSISSVFPSISLGDFGFNGAFTHNALADLLLGLPLEFLQAGGKNDKKISQTRYAIYAQDELHVSHNFTFNLGLRYERSPGFIDPQNLEITFVPGEQSVESPTLPLGVLRPGDPGIPRTIFDTAKTHFAPRFGVAWDPFGDGKTSVRAGYGIFFDDSSLVQIALVLMPPDFQPIDVLVGSALKSFSDPFGGNSPFKTPLTFPLNFAPGFTVTWTSRDFRIPYVQQWNFTLQRQITPTLAVEVAYAGDKGTHLQGTIDPNQAVWAPGASAANRQSRRPLPLVGNVLDITSRFDSNYNGLQLTVTKRASHGLSFQTAYTFSKAIDDDTLPTGFYLTPGQQSRAQNSSDLRSERGLSAFDIRHRFVGSLIYELPFFKSARGFRSAALGGWRLNGIFTAMSGRPFSVFDSRDPKAGGLVDNTRPNLVGNPNLPAGQQTPQQWFNAAAFQRITPGPAWGTAGRNILFTDHLVDLDMGLAKSFTVTERYKLEFRWEVFNVFNHPNFGYPVNDLNSPSFGQVLSTSSPERQMQFALKLLF